jgi:hypothetical protein
MDRLSRIVLTVIRGQKIWKVMDWPMKQFSTAIRALQAEKNILSGQDSTYIDQNTIHNEDDRRTIDDNMQRVINMGVTKRGNCIPRTMA